MGCAAFTNPKENTNQVRYNRLVGVRRLSRIKQDNKKKHAHPLPNAYDEIQRAAGHKFNCFLNLQNTFWRIQIHPDDREKTAFVKPFGIYEWLVVPFGLCNAPATFQFFMEEVLVPFQPFVARLFDEFAV